MWHFTESDYDSKNVKDPTESTVQSHAEELSPLKIFAREVLQNAVDNLSPFNESGKVKVSFRLHELSGDVKDDFLDAIGFEEIAGHLKSVSQDQILKKTKTLLPTPEDIKSPAYVLKVLTIEDYGTRGLVGPEHEMEKDEYEESFPDIPHCFLGLCRNIGDSQKSGPAAGGTHGFGKTVLWKNSRIRTVLFYSNLDQPYIEGGYKHNARFFGQVRLPGHYLDGNAYHGQGYLGNRENKLTRALYDEAARERVVRLGIPIRDHSLPGTTIIIVDFDDPDQSDDGETSSKTITGLRDSAERYYWPAIVAGRLEVDVDMNASGSPATLELAQPHLRDDLVPFTKLYKAMIAGETNGDTTVRYVDVDVPKGPEEEPRGDAQLAMGVHLCRVGDATSAAIRNTVALVRGAGMVVGYWRVPRRGLGARDYCGIALGGLACPLKDGAHNQEHFEKLLAWAEPVTHDNWTNNTEALKFWRGSRPAVRRVRDAIALAVSELTTTMFSPEGDAAPLLAGMFPFTPGNTPGPEPRDIHIEVVEGPHALDSGSAERLRYGFTIKITVPQRVKFRGKQKPDNWKVTCSYGFLGEGRHRKVVERVESRFTAFRIDGGDWQARADDFDVQPSYQEAVRDKPVTYEIRGETELMDPNVASVAKHDLAVEVYRGYEE